MTPSFVSVILPVHNQADHVATIVADYRHALAKLPLPYELLLVVNGSKDRSLEVCREMEGTSDDVRVHHEEHGGWGRAVRRGLKEATGDLICYTNLARTSPEDLTLLLLYATVHEDVVIKASRKIRESAIRRAASLLYNLECRALFDLKNWDVNGTPKVFPRSFVKLLSLSRQDDLIDVEFNVVCERESYRMLEVPIFSSRRHGGRSTTGYWSAAKLYWGAFQLWRSMSAKTS